MSATRGGEVVLAMDTATTKIVLALGTLSGDPVAATSWLAGYRDGETLLPALERLLADQGIERSQLAAIVVGTGPGAFTGLRVGIATAKGLAHGLGRPIVGIPTGAASLAAAARVAGVPVARCVVLLPAGPSDRIVVRDRAWRRRCSRPGLEPDLLGHRPPGRGRSRRACAGRCARSWRVGTRRDGGRAAPRGGGPTGRR